MSSNSGIGLRLGAACGAGYVVAALVGNELSNAGSSAGTGSPDALADLQRPLSATNMFGTGLEVGGLVAFVFFLGAVVALLRRGEGPTGWLAGVAGGAGMITLAVKLSSVAPFIAARQRAEVLTPDLARTLIDVNAAAFVVSGLTFAVFVLAASCSGLAGRTLPRWLGWVGVVIGVLGLVTPTIGIFDPDNYNPLPFLGALLWTLVASVLLTIRGGRRITVPAALDPVAEASSPGVSAATG